VEIDPSKAIEKVREILADPNPDRNYKFGDPQPTKVFIPEWGPDTDTSNVAAGQPSPYLFPDKPLVPTTDAVFDGEYSADSIKVLEGMGSARPESRAFAPCRWHGEKYIDQADGDRCTALDPGSKYLSDLYAQQFVPRRPFAEEVAFSNAIARFNDPPMSLEVVADHHTDETVRNVDLDEAAPILHPAPEAWEPTVNIPSMDEMRQAMREPQPEWDECVGQGQDDETKDSSRGGIITVATILTILGLIAAYF